MLLLMICNCVTVWFVLFCGCYLVGVDLILLCLCRLVGVDLICSLFGDLLIILVGVGCFAFGLLVGLVIV